MGQASEGFGILGKRPDRQRIIPGLWALHPYRPHFPETDWTRGVGVQFSMWYSGTFVNSYGVRAFVAGVERHWFAGEWGALSFGTGYRAGLVTGYDERLVEIAKYTPLLPFGGILAWMQLGPFGFDAFYVYRAITLEASLGF